MTELLRHQVYGFRWVRLEDEPRIQHCFRPCDKDGNVSLCEEFIAIGDDDQPVNVNKLQGEKKRKDIACQICLKIFRDTLKK